MASRSRRRSAIAEIAILLALACALGLGVNILRGEGIPLREDWTAKKFAAAAKSGGRITLDLALTAMKTKSALFLDARPLEDYGKGHIQSAQSLPFDPLAKDLETRVKALPKDRPLILYCSGVSCALAEELAEFLHDFGYKNTLLLVEGFEGWTAAGYPAEKGTP
jgi:rhodanese-related sulfurtransferase